MSIEEDRAVSINLGVINPGYDPNLNEVDNMKKTAGNQPPKNIGFHDVTYTTEYRETLPYICNFGKSATREVVKDAR